MTEITETFLTDLLDTTRTEQAPYGEFTERPDWMHGAVLAAQDCPSCDDAPAMECDEAEAVCSGCGWIAA